MPWIVSTQTIFAVTRSRISSIRLPSKLVRIFVDLAGLILSGSFSFCFELLPVFFTLTLLFSLERDRRRYASCLILYDSEWDVGGIHMEGGAGQMNTVFSWGTCRESGIITNCGKAKIN